MNQWMRESQWLSKTLNECANDWVNQRINEAWLKQRTNEWTNVEWMNERVHEWMTDWVTDWLTEWMDEQSNERTNELPVPQVSHLALHGSEIPPLSAHSSMIYFFCSFCSSSLLLVQPIQCILRLTVWPYGQELPFSKLLLQCGQQPQLQSRIAIALQHCTCFPARFHGLFQRQTHTLTNC